MGGRHSNAAGGALTSHFEPAMGALVWRSPIAFELCNSHRGKQVAAAQPPRRPSWTSSTSDGCSSANASIAGWMQKSCFGSRMRTPAVPPRREPRSTERATSIARTAGRTGERTPTRNSTATKPNLLYGDKVPGR